MTNTSQPARSRIVVGIDGSEQSKHALRWAAYLAEITQADITAVGVWHLPTGYGAVPIPDGWNPRQELESALAETVEEVLGDARPQGLRLLIREGNPAKELLEESKDAAMLVVGSRGHGGFMGLLLGSVSASVAEHAGCPVLVVHGDAVPPVAAA